MPSPELDGPSAIGKYEIVARLGKGGMGEVYLGKHQLLDRPAAIKVLRKKYAKRRELVERFFREARIAAALKHPSVVEIYDFGYHDDGTAYLAMEYLEGEDLRARLRRCKTLAPETALRYTKQLLSVLAVAHAEGIVHRDLKPENIFIVDNPLITGGEELKLLDFGVAKLAADSSTPALTQTGEIIGTPTYMAPEQCRATGEYDGRTDLYALGCILYEMITGRPPFVPTGATQQIYLAHLGTPAPRLGSQAADLDAVVARLLQKQPEDRFDSAEQVVEVLERLGDPGATQVALAPRMTGRASLEAETLGPSQLAKRGGRVALRPEQPASQAAATLDLKASKPATVDIGPSKPGTVNLRPKSGPHMPAPVATGPVVSESTLDALARPPRAPRWPYAAAAAIVVAGVALVIALARDSAPEQPAAGSEPAQPTETTTPASDEPHVPAAAPAAAAAIDAGAPDAALAPDAAPRRPTGHSKPSRGPDKGTRKADDLSVNPFD